MKSRERLSSNFPNELLVSLALFQEAWEVLNAFRSGDKPSAEKYFNFLGATVQVLLKENPEYLRELLDLSGAQHAEQVLVGPGLEEKLGVKVQEPEGAQSGLLIASIGRIASGKGTFSEILKNNYAFQALELSSVAIVMAALTQNNKTPDRSQIGAVAKELKNTFGPTILLRTLFRLLFLNQGKNNRLMIDGVRSGEVAIGIKQSSGKLFDSAALIGISTGKTGTADILERFNRSKARGNNKDLIDFQEFKRLNAEEADGISEALEYVDHEIINDEMRHFLDQIELLMLMYDLNQLSE
jgi:hypothetical protein